MQNRLRTLTLELEIENEDGDVISETYHIREIPTHIKLRMTNWENVPESAFYEIIAACVLDDDGNARYSIDDVQYIEPDIVGTLVTEIQALSKDRKISVAKKKS